MVYAFFNGEVFGKFLQMNWSESYVEEKNRIQRVLGKNLVEIYHVGSTSVPNLLAKPVIDIIAVVQSLNFNHNSLEKICYMYKGNYNLPFRKFFSLKSVRLNVHLHVFEENDPEIELNLRFRDYLRNNLESKYEYALFKRELLNQNDVNEKYGMFFNYTTRKQDFIHKIIRKTGFDKFRLVICSHISE